MDASGNNANGILYNGANVPKSRYHRFGGSSTLRGYDEQYFMAAQFQISSLPECAHVSSKLWTAGIARRIEAQLQADWALIPALRNLDFRHSMYAGSSLKFQTKVETADALAAQARDYCQAAMNLYQHHLWHGYQISRTGRKQYINGDITKLPFAHGLTAVEKRLLHNLGFLM